MARNLVPISDVVNDFILSVTEDDYSNDVSDTLVHNYALRGLREMGFDTLQVVKSLKLTVNQTLGTVDLPDDFVDLVKVGIVGSDGLVYVFGQNKNINYSQKYRTDSAGNGIDSNSDGVFDRVNAKEKPELLAAYRGYSSYVFQNYLDQNTYGALYGIGGGHYTGEYRMNYEQNRLEIASSDNYTDVVIEYIADEARSSNPSIHVYAENALRSYIYYRVIERKSSVPYNEKMRARQEYYNERRLANARLKSFSKDEALKTIRKNFKLSPKH